MKLYRHKLTSGILLALVAGAASALAEEQDISCNAVPMVVRGAFEKAFPKATIKECAKEVEKGKTAYEISSTEGGIRRDVLFHADGTLIVIEEAIAFQSAPDLVQQAVRKMYPGGEITLAEKITRDGAVLYEFKMKHRGKRVETVFDPSGNEVKP
jgi:Putative beta-lactamase-inhibitor-like, PepSY-like